MKSHRWAKWFGLVGGIVLLSPLTGCLAAIQREIEVIFAFDAVGNSLLLPQTVLAEFLIRLLR